jgi:hypothetical protein
VPIEGSDPLALISEISVAFVGLSMVVGVLHPGQHGADVRLRSMRAVAETGLIAGGGAMLALLLNGFGVSHAGVWRLSGLVVSITWLVALGYAMRRFTQAGELPFRRRGGEAPRGRVGRITG